VEPLKQAQEVADKILKMTRSIALTGKKEEAEQEAEAFSVLMDERESMIDELTDLRLQIDPSEADSAEFKAILKTINQITELDKAHMVIMESFREEAQASYKEIKQGQRIHAGYNPLPGDEASSKINIKS